MGEAPETGKRDLQDLSTRSGQIIHRLDSDRVMGGEWCRGDIGGGSI